MTIETPAAPLDQAKSEAFVGRMVDMMNTAALSLMLSIGYKTHLFDRLADQAPATSAEIAARAGLQERYVREWLAALVTGRIIEYEPTQQTYYLPPEYAAWLTRAAGVNNFAYPHTNLALVAWVQDLIVDCFTNGGGVPYSAFPNFQETLAEGRAAGYDGSLVQTVLPLIPGLVERLKAGIDVADIGCGSGHAINVMAQAFPHSRFTGYDFSEDGIKAAQTEGAQLGLSNASFEVKDAARLDLSGQYDFITAFDSIHDQVKPAQVLRAIEEALRPQSNFLMVDVRASSLLEKNMTHPLAPFLYTLSLNHCMTVSLASDGAGLGTMWGEELACQMLEQAGFSQVEVKQIEADETNSYYLATKN
jgi:2-polyprenyl-3-methyl-5-hydroxy-6-metoxy-1,4-benzoquinol methylase